MSQNVEETIADLNATIDELTTLVGDLEREVRRLDGIALRANIASGTLIVVALVIAVGWLNRVGFFDALARL